MSQTEAELTRQIRERRESLGYPTQALAAHAAGMSEATWQKFETNKHVGRTNNQRACSLLDWTSDARERLRRGELPETLDEAVAQLRRRRTEGERLSRLEHQVVGATDLAKVLESVVTLHEMVHSLASETTELRSRVDQLEKLVAPPPPVRDKAQ